MKTSRLILLRRSLYHAYPPARNITCKIFFYFHKKGVDLRRYSVVSAHNRRIERIGVFGVRNMRTVFLIIVLAMIMLFPRESTEASRQSLQIWGLDVVPSLFPYMVLCRMISGQLQTAGVPVTAATTVLGLIGGSPSGAAVLAGYGGCISKRKLYALCGLCGTISPMFLLGTVDRWFALSGISGRMILAAHLSGAVLCAIIVYTVTKEKEVVSHSPAQCVYSPDHDPIGKSIEAVLRVGGYIVFYSMIASMLRRLPWMNSLTMAVLHAVLEISGGLYAISSLDISPFLKAMILSAVTGFSGISILSQNYVFLRMNGITMKDLLCMGVLRGLCSAVVMLILFAISL